MTTTMDQMVSQLQQELFTLKAQVAARVQISEAAQRPGTSEGIPWQGGGLHKVVEDGSILLWIDQGVRDDAGVGC